MIWHDPESLPKLVIVHCRQEPAEDAAGTGTEGGGSHRSTVRLLDGSFNVWRVLAEHIGARDSRLRLTLPGTHGKLPRLQAESRLSFDDALVVQKPANPGNPWHLTRTTSGSSLPKPFAAASYGAERAEFGRATGTVLQSLQSDGSSW